MNIFTRFYFPKCDFNPPPPPIQTKEYSSPTGTPALGKKEIKSHQ